jgi:succinate dehydrogenase / fumarate reductase iron-sulfur subunit
LEVLRYDAAAGGQPRFQAYEVTVDRPTSVLEALLQIQDDQDPTLAFRYACRGAVCGSCAMAVNGRLQLACRVQLHTLPAHRVILEPLPGFEILKDLVVDMDDFWEKYRRVQPWLQAAFSAGPENRVSEREQQRTAAYVNCILCGLCYAACPVMRRNPRFTGPAALAKLHRFRTDSRDDRGPATLQQEDSPQGLWACHTIMACCEVCPREVRPADGIRALRRQLLSQRVRQILGGSGRET